MCFTTTYRRGTINPPMPRCAMTEHINLAMPRLASNDRALMSKGQHRKILSYHKTFNSIWPCLALQVITDRKGQHYLSHSDHASQSKWWLRGNAGKHNLAMPHCASNDWAHICVLPQHVQLTLAMPRAPCNCMDWGPAPAFSFWPYLAVQVMTAGQHRLEGHASLCKQWLWARNDQGQHRPKPGKEKKSHNFKVGLFFCFPLYLLIFS